MQCRERTGGQPDARSDSAPPQPKAEETARIVGGYSPAAHSWDQPIPSRAFGCTPDPRDTPRCWPNRIRQINASIWMQEQVRQSTQGSSGIGTTNRFSSTPKLDIPCTPQTAASSDQARHRCPPSAGSPSQVTPQLILCCAGPSIASNGCEQATLRVHKLHHPFLGWIL